MNYGTSEIRPIGIVFAFLEGRYMGRHSLRILAQAGLSGVFFAAKILRGELPRYRLPLPEFAANVIPCSAPLMQRYRRAKISTSHLNQIEIQFSN